MGVESYDDYNLYIIYVARLQYLDIHELCILKVERTQHVIFIKLGRISANKVLSPGVLYPGGAPVKHNLYKTNVHVYYI